MTRTDLYIRISVKSAYKCAYYASIILTKKRTSKLC